MDTLTQQACLNAITDLNAATTAADRAEIVRLLQHKLGVSADTVYRHLKSLGWKSGRKERADKGASRVTAEDLRQAAVLTASGLNKRGQPNVPLSEAHRIAQEQQLGAAKVSVGHLGRLLRRQGLGLDQMRAGEASIQRVSAHPNHVWFFDISVCAQWYFRDSSGKKLEPYTAAQIPYKPEQFKSKTIHRYVMVDHTTGAYYVQYYYAGGERAEDIIDFFYRAMAPKAIGSDKYPMRGLPRRIVMDPGSANRSQMVRNLLGELGIIPEYHESGNAKASGAVETRHNHWQRSYEGRLRAKPASELGELNRWAEGFAALANSERPHSRHGRSPMDAWASIRSEQLRECPERDLFFQLATTDARVGTLDNYLWLHADGRKWQVRGENVHPQQKVHFRRSPFIAQGIRVFDQWDRELAATELSFDENGFNTNGLRAEWDSEEARGASHKSVPAQAVAARVADNAEPMPVAGLFEDIDQRLERQHYQVAGGQTWEARESVVAAAPRMGLVDALAEVRQRLDRRLSPAEGDWWREQLGEGCTAAELDQLWTSFAGETPERIAL
ncbi:MAG TPA: hypothetical protein PKW90_01515 [Myxococcota bacterium]|nr:hypothetical protein [Myxococcota bacterium]